MTHAVVIGGSIAGLTMAHVLAREGVFVTIIDHQSADEILPRQASHIHMLLRGGLSQLELLFPVICNEIESCGAVRTDFSSDHRWFLHGTWKPRLKSSCVCYQHSRAALQAIIRRRVLESPRIQIQRSVFAGRILIDDSSARVRGVQVSSRSTNHRITVPAEIVVDASGANSKMPTWLCRCGWPTPPRQVQQIGLRYSSSRFILHNCLPDCRMMSIYPIPPNLRRGGALHLLETGEALVSLFAYSEDRPPARIDDFISFAASLAQPDLGEVLRNAQPVGTISTFHAPHQHWLRYDKIRIPDGLIIAGDAHCRLDPLFGQGMSIALFQATALGALLNRFGPDAVETTERFHRLSQSIIQGPWLLTTSAGRSESGGHSALMFAIEQYLSCFFEAASQRPHMHALFLDVMHMRKRLVALLGSAALGATLNQFWVRTCRQFIQKVRSMPDTFVNAVGRRQ